MNADSIKARLKNYAVETGHTFQEALVYYGLERTIYRISVSKYAEHFVLKGGIFLYAIFDKNYERTTTDVDLLARRISNSRVEMKEIFREILTQDADDALTFDIDSMEAPRVNAYSLESSIAEKLEAIVYNGYLNSRYKDFYDIYILTSKYAFEYAGMKKAVTETFQHRGTEMSMSTAAFGEEFTHDALHQTR